MVKRVRRGPRRAVHRAALGLVASTIWLAWPQASTPPAAPSFESAVVPVLQKTCVACHNDRLASGGLNLKSLNNAGSIAANRQDWEVVLGKLKAGEMPPPPVPKPPGIAAMISYIEREFERLDRNVKPDPGRITARGFVAKFWEEVLWLAPVG